MSLRPDLADKSTMMGGMIGTQLAIALMALALALMVLRLPAASATRTMGTVALAGFATAVVIQLSDWNWYGFAMPYALVNVVDNTIGLAIGGLVLGALRNPWMGAGAEAAGVAAPAGAYEAPGTPGAPARRRAWAERVRPASR